MSKWLKWYPWTFSKPMSLLFRYILGHPVMPIFRSHMSEHVVLGNQTFWKYFRWMLTNRLSPISLDLQDRLGLVRKWALWFDIFQGTCTYLQFQVPDHDHQKKTTKKTLFSEWQTSFTNQRSLTNAPPQSVNKHMAVLFSKTIVKRFGAVHTEPWVWMLVMSSTSAV